MKNKWWCHELWTESGEKLHSMIKEYESEGKDNEKLEEVRIWQEYPRPQMKREGFLLLNGKWKLNRHSAWVPFPPQAMLSEYGKFVGEHFIYQKVFCLPDFFTKERVLLHFGAVDQICEVWLNDVRIGRHEGGYLPFSIDITDTVKRDGENLLEVRVLDTLSKVYPYGKQKKWRGGMWYTPVSGIWQSVWLENTDEVYISRIVLTPDLESVDIKLEVTGNTDVCKIPGFKVVIELEHGERIEQRLQGTEGRVSLSNHICADGNRYQPILWSPEKPHLYSMKVYYGKDEVETYFALRTVEVKEISGINRVCLNGEPIFMHGVLDQGYYSDGIYLPAQEAEYERDILRMKKLGFNMLRKHIKIEPECFYYYCDLHGMLVMQDMVNSGRYSFILQTAVPTIGFKHVRDTGGNTNSKRRRIFRAHTKETIEHLYNHPCIVAYTIFNEGWGQFESDSLYEYVKSLDDTRLIDSTSGWFAQTKSDFDSEHVYFKTVNLQVQKRPMFLSECGGYSLRIEDHYFNKYRYYGYGKCKSIDELTQKIIEMYHKMVLPAIPKGLCGCVYTQLSDVEDEINGLYTYDRRVCKVNKEQFQELAAEILKILG